MILEGLRWDNYYEVVGLYPQILKKDMGAGLEEITRVFCELHLAQCAKREDGIIGIVTH